MKKVLFFTVILSLFFTTVGFADGVRYSTLGAPSTLIKDTSILEDYPGALQMFPNSIWAKVTGIGAYTLGFAYIDNPFVGLAALYTKSQSTYNISVPATSLWNGFTANSITSTNHIMFLGYGVKLGSLYVGASLINGFPTDTILNETIDSNGKTVNSKTFSGFYSTITPSAVLDMGNLKVYGAIPIKLNLTKYNQFTSYQSNEVTISPNTMEEIGLKIKGIYKLGAKYLAAVTIAGSMEDTGYEVVTKTNGANEFSGTNYISTSMDASLILGMQILPTDGLKLFFDIPFGIERIVFGHWEGVVGSSYNTVTTWSLPVLKFGTEIALAKKLSFRASATPSWKRIITKPASYDSNNANTETTVDNYGLSSALGLGYHTGRFYINAEVSATTFTTETLKPLYIINGLFTGTAQSYFTSVQINYVW